MNIVYQLSDIIFYLVGDSSINKFINDCIFQSHIQWNPDFSNPHFFEPPDNSNQKSFPLLSQTL